MASGGETGSLWVSASWKLPPNPAQYVSPSFSALAGENTRVGGFPLRSLPFAWMKNLKGWLLRPWYSWSLDEDGV